MKIWYLSLLRKATLKHDFRSYQVGVAGLIFAGAFNYVNYLWVRAVKTLTRLCECAASSEPSLLAYAIKIKPSRSALHWLKCV